MAELAHYVNSIDRILHLRSVPFLRGLGATEVAALAEHMRTRIFRAGELLVQPGEMVSSGFSIVEGRVALRREGVLVRRLGPLEGVGMAALWSEEPEDLEARAELETVALEIQRDPLMEVLEDQFSILRHVLGTITGFILEARKQMPSAGFGPANELPVDPPSRPLDLIERLFVLRRIPTFFRGSVDALVELARHQTEVRYPAGHVLWLPGAPADHSYGVLAGEVACEYENGSFGMGPRQGFGVLEAMAGKPRWYKATVVKDLVALRSSVETALDVLEDHPRLALGMMSQFARDARRLTIVPTPTIAR
jgi:CRP-like cAMP-binding protein